MEYIFNSKYYKCIIEKTVIEKSLGNVLCFLKLRDKNNILCGCSNRTFCLYDMNTGQYKTSMEILTSFFC